MNARVIWPPSGALHGYGNDGPRGWPCRAMTVVPCGVIVVAATHPTRSVPVLVSSLPILSRLLPAPIEAAVIPVDDDPATLARLERIMSDRIRPCPSCGDDPHVCRAIGCGADDAPLLLAQPAADHVDRVEASALIDELFDSEHG